MNVGTSASGAQTDELLAKSQELAILRDSNTTLRSESTKTAERVQSLSEKVNQLEAQLAPLREQVSVLETEVATRDGHIKLLEQDNARWKTRNEHVLVKYDRIDPVELQSLKDRVDSLQTERDALASEKETEKIKWDAEVRSVMLALLGILQSLIQVCLPDDQSSKRVRCQQGSLPVPSGHGSRPKRPHCFSRARGQHSPRDVCRCRRNG